MQFWSDLSRKGEAVSLRCLKHEMRLLAHPVWVPGPWTWAQAKLALLLPSCIRGHTRQGPAQEPRWEGLGPGLPAGKRRSPAQLSDSTSRIHSPPPTAFRTPTGFRGKQNPSHPFTFNFSHPPSPPSPLCFNPSLFLYLQNSGFRLPRRAISMIVRGALFSAPICCWYEAATSPFKPILSHQGPWTSRTNF